GAPAPDGVALHVADQGPGFADSVAATAFERFTRGDPARSSTGAGLGLAIVSAVVGAHGGTVALSTDATSGAEVILTLPAPRPSAMHAVQGTKGLPSPA